MTIEAGKRLPTKADSIHVNTLRTLPTPAGMPNVWEAQFYYAEGDVTPTVCPNASTEAALAVRDQAMEAGASKRDAEAAASKAMALHVLETDPETGWPRCAAEGCGWRFCQPGQRPQAFDGAIKDAIRVPADTADEQVVERIRAKVQERQDAERRREELAQLVVLDKRTALLGATEGDAVEVSESTGQGTVYRHVAAERLRRSDEWTPPERERVEMLVPDGASVKEIMAALAEASTAREMEAN